MPIKQFPIQWQLGHLFWSWVSHPQASYFGSNRAFVFWKEAVWCIVYSSPVLNLQGMVTELFRLCLLTEALGPGLSSLIPPFLHLLYSSRVLSFCVTLWCLSGHSESVDPSAIHPHITWKFYHSMHPHTVLVFSVKLYGASNIPVGLQTPRWQVLSTLYFILPRTCIESK
jgi:hypothetical protein